MPNWVYNIVEINGDADDIIKFIEQHFNEEGLFDFNTFVREPLSESDCEDKYNFNTRDGELNSTLACNKDTLENPVDRKWFNWLDWRRKYWGTKWNAGSESRLLYDFDKIREHNAYNLPVRIFFTTAWHPPFPIFEQIYKMHPELEISIVYYSTENGEFGEFFSWKENHEEVEFCHYDLKNYKEETINNRK